MIIDDHEQEKLLQREVILNGPNGMFLAGSDDTSRLTGRHISHNFVGIISEVKTTAFFWWSIDEHCPT
jgi:hypothetical protein